MPRGQTGRLTSAGKREKTVTVRLTEVELARWTEARERTPRREMGAWVRSVVEEALTGSAVIPGDVARVPPVNEDVFHELAALGNNLNQLVRWTHVNDRLHPALLAAVEAVGNAALVVRGMEPIDDQELADVEAGADPEDDGDYLLDGPAT